MIYRVFRVTIFPDLRQEFEAKFADISVNAVKKADGFLSVEICKPSIWQPNEYMMISCWQDEDSLKKFAGENWSQAYIPQGMEKFVQACWVHHFVNWS